MVTILWSYCFQPSIHHTALDNQHEQADKTQHNKFTQAAHIHVT
jgi:hypothetical protein